MQRAAMIFSLVLLVPSAWAAPAPMSRPGYFGFAFTLTASQKEEGSYLTVQYLAPGSPADHAGLRLGDLIIAIDGKQLQMRDGLDVVLELAKAKVGEPLTLSIIRERKRITSQIFPEWMPDPQYEQWKTNLAMLRARRAQRPQAAVTPR